MVGQGPVGLWEVLIVDSVWFGGCALGGGERGEHIDFVLWGSFPPHALAEWPLPCCDAGDVNPPKTRCQGEGLGN